MRVDYFFTPVSPYAYLGHARFVALLQRTGSEVQVLPVDYGVIFPASGGVPLPQRAPQRQAYRLVELQRFSRWLQVPLNLKPAFFPLASEAASRLLVATQDEVGAMAALELAGRIGRAIWAEERNAADVATLQALLAEAGLPASLWDAAQQPRIAEAYQANTQRALQAGVFGAPSYVIDGEIFWGQDRLEFVERRLLAGAPG